MLYILSMYIKTSTKNNKWVVSKTHYLVEWYREDWKVKHRNLCNLGSLSDEKILWLKAVLNDNSSKVSLIELKGLKLLCSKEYWSTAVFWKLYDQYLKPHINKKYQDIIEAMVINRVFVSSHISFYFSSKNFVKSN